MAIALVAMAAAAAIKAAGSITQGEQQARADNNQADQANAQGDIAATQGYAREDVTRRESAQKLGAQYAATAGAGVDPSAGSALDVANTSATNLEYDALNVRYGGLAQRDQLRQQANNLRASASNSRSSGYAGAFTGILSTAANYGMGGGFNSLATTQTTPAGYAAGGMT